jgi:hypothetical protein
MLMVLSVQTIRMDRKTPRLRTSPDTHVIAFAAKLPAANSGFEAPVRMERAALDGTRAAREPDSANVPWQSMTTLPGVIGLRRSVAFGRLVAQEGRRGESRYAHPVH